MAQHVLAVLGWDAETALDWRFASDRIVIVPSTASRIRLTESRLWLPAQARCRLGLIARDRVALFAETDTTELAVYPAVVLENLLRSHSTAGRSAE